MVGRGLSAQRDAYDFREPHFVCMIPMCSQLATCADPGSFVGIAQIVADLFHQFGAAAERLDFGADFEVLR